MVQNEIVMKPMSFEDVIPRYPKRKKTWLGKLKKEAKHFCLNTALHGFKFIVLPNRILLERVIWSIICGTSLTLALMLVCIAWFNFQSDPTDLVTDSNHYPIWHYPFPAVTVCSFNKISKRHMFQLAAELTDDRSNKTKVAELAWDLRVIYQLIQNAQGNVSDETNVRVQKLLESRQLTVDSLLERLAPKCSQTILRCVWKGEEQRCDSIFERIRSYTGFCCSFNYFALRQHNFEGNFKIKSPNEPRRVTACGPQTGLEIMLSNHPKDYFASIVPSIGHEILLHNPYYFPDWNVQAMISRRKTISLISVNPTITDADEIDGLSVEERQCLFPNEKTLAYFSQYNFHNCMVECRMNLTYELCGCVPYFYVQDESGPKGRKICNLLDLKCLTNNEHLIISSVPGFDYSKADSNSVDGTEKGVCDCLSDCETTDYLAESSSGVLNRKFSLNRASLYEGIKLQNHSVVKIFFNDLVGVKNRRYIQFNWHSLLAYFGGLLGLFLGFSFVSGIEIIYFFTIRLLARAKMGKTKTKDIHKVQPMVITGQLYPRNLPLD